MSKKLLNAAINGLIERLDKTEKFVLAEAPELCRQIVREGYVDNSMRAVTSGSLMVTLAVLSALFGYQAYENFGDNGKTVMLILSSLATGVASVVASNTFYYSMNLLLTVKLCPKLFLARELRSLLK